MSFESRFAAVGRALDDMIDALRNRSAHSGRSRLSPGSIRDALSERVSAAIDRSRSAMAEQRSRMLDPRLRRRIGVVLLVVASVALTAAITRELSSGGSGGGAGAGADGGLLRSLAEAREARNAPTAAPRPVRASATGGR